MRLPPATWWFRRKVVALPVWRQRQHAEKQVARWLTVILSGKRRPTLQLPSWHRTARLLSSNRVAGRGILNARWQRSVMDKLTCRRSTAGKASLKQRLWRGQVVGAKAPTSTPRQPLSNSRKHKVGAMARTGMEVVHEHGGVHSKEHKVGAAAPTDMKSSM